MVASFRCGLSPEGLRAESLVSAMEVCDVVAPLREDTSGRTLAVSLEIKLQLELAYFLRDPNFVPLANFPSCLPQCHLPRGPHQSRANSRSF